MILTINTASNKQKEIIMNIAKLLEVQEQGKLVLTKEQTYLKWWHKIDTIQQEISNGTRENEMHWG